MEIRTHIKSGTQIAAASCLLAGSAMADILLIDDQGGFGPLAANLRAEGYSVTVRNSEFGNLYANLLNQDFLQRYNFIVYAERGTGSGGNLPAIVGNSLETYLQAGGNLLLTGYDALYVDSENVTANLIRATAPEGTLVGSSGVWNVVTDHPITNGPYGNFFGQVFSSNSYDVSVTPNTAAGAIELVSTGNPRITGKLIFTDLPGTAGSVGYWNGGALGTGTNAQAEFSYGSNSEAVFRNYVAMIEGPAPGFDGQLAGADIEVGDSDGDGFVTQLLDGSKALQAVPDIVSWDWSWPGGSATGQKAELTLPANNTPITVTLTATDGGGATHVDTLQITPFSKVAGLFTDITAAKYAGVTSAANAFQVTGTLEGDTLVIDPVGVGVPDVFRRAANVWTPSPFTEGVTDIRAIDDTTLVSGQFASGTDFKVHRLVGGQWISTPLGLSAAPPIYSRIDYAFDSQSVVFADLFNNTYGNSGGRVFAYDWAGDNWNHTELLPPGGVAASDRWGDQIAVDGDLVAVLGGLGTDRLKLFRKSGATWTHEASIEPIADFPHPIQPFSSALSVGNGVVVAAGQSFPADKIVILEKDGASWIQTIIALDPAGPFGNSAVGVDMDSDGKSFNVHDSAGNFLLVQRDPLAADWASATITKRRLPLADLNANPQLTTTHFSGGEIVVSDPVSGAIRIFDKDVPFDSINAEPKANAGEDIATTSFDGQAVAVFLNGGGSSDPNYEEVLEAEWTWAGGSATGLFADVQLDPSVTSVELKITDSRGAISRDTVAVNIDAPPVVDPGEDVIVVDSDGDGSIRVNVNANLLSSDYPVSSWSWAWPGGILSGQSGTLTLGNAANGQPVTLTTLDANGLSSQSSFSFKMLSSQPTPVMLQPVGGGPTDRYGSAVAIDNGVALVGAPKKPYSGIATGATYLARNLNGLWPQIQLAPGTKQGDAVIVDGDLAFVGAQDAGGGSPGFEIGQVIVYRKNNGVWQFNQTIAPPPGVDSFGASMAKSGNQLLIGAPQVYGNQPRCGAAFLYELNNGSWMLSRRFDPPVEKFLGLFGTKVAIDGGVIAISQPGFSDPSSVVTFERIGSVWTYESELFSAVPSPPQFNENYHFGQGIGLSESELLIGSPVEGLVYRYSRNAGNWTANGVINPNRYFFGSSIAMKNDVAVVGSVIENVGLGGAIPGSATSYNLINGNWQETGYLNLTPAIDPAIVETPNFAAALSFDGSDLIVGAPTARNSVGVQTGKSYIYRNFAGINPNVNYEPLANAGPNIDVTDTIVRDSLTNEITEPLGSELVALNGTASTDQENQIVSHQWSWQGGSAIGANANARFPVGTTLVTLTVTDHKGIINTDTITVTVSLPQSAPAALPPSSGNSLALDLFSPLSKWRLSSEFLWHGDNEAAVGVVDGATYQVEILPYPGSTEVVTAVVTVEGNNTTQIMDLELPEPPTATGTLSFPETSQGFSWRLVGESTWRDVTDDGDAFAEDVEFSVPEGLLRIEFKPVAGFTTPQTRVLNVIGNALTPLDWAEYLRINSFDPAKTFQPVPSPDLAASPYRYTGMIRSALGRGTGTVVAERVVLTAAHLFFDPNGLQWADVQWFSRQQQGTRQAPPLTPRGVLYQTSYAKLIAPDSVEGTVADLPEDPQEVDFAVLYFSDETTWDQGSANFLQSTSSKNWLSGTENKHAVGYPQRSQVHENRGRMLEKQFATPLQSLGTGLYETTEVFGDGGASGSALFVQPAGGSNFYPAAILLAGQNRAVYRVIDEDITRMIKDGEDAATGNDDVLDNDSSLLTFDGLGSFTTVGVQVFPPAIRTKARWTITPVKGAVSANMVTTKQIAFNEKWSSYTISFAAISGYRTPAPLRVLNGQVIRNSANIHPFTYTAISRSSSSPIDIWKQANNVTDLLDDSDDDGMKDLLEYALDRNPAVPDVTQPIRIKSQPSQNTHVEYEVYVSNAAEGIFYHVKASNNLDRSNAVTLQTFTSDDGISDYLTVTDNQPKASSPKRFAWVEIEVPADP